MRVPRICGRQRDASPVDLQCAIAQDSDDAHLHSDHSFAVRVCDCACARSSIGVDSQRPVPDVQRAGKVQRHATQTIAAHLGKRTVRIDDAHARPTIRSAWRQHEKNPIRADAQATIAQSNRTLCGKTSLVVRLDDDEIVAEPLVFEKRY